MSSKNEIKVQKFGLSALILMVVTGGIFIAVGVYMVKDIKIDSRWTKVSAEVVSLVRSKKNLYQPVFEYSVDGQNYQVTSEIASSIHPSVGDKGEIAYNPNNPDQAKVVETVGNWIFLLLFPVSGTIVLVFAPISFVRSFKRMRLIKHLVQKGQKLQGVLVDVQSPGGINKKGYYKVIVSATDTAGVVQNYISDNVSNVGGLALVDFRSRPIAVGVYIDPANPKDYYVDVADLPNLTSQEIIELVTRQIKK